ncbi:nitrate reductase molybdenum cofactor assembly chaperone [Bacillus kwashiorkori]|uniref:nitrate reductase molybdenum cofactor assembly chaperone n=1 Tax=Bacillus kwashiorkori TaxID=1522318 RepID=UPI0007804A76|nr:nitrate reductase molybdenum cofactor assembly chaperone [Bacillus kwashiorkori]
MDEHRQNIFSLASYLLHYPEEELLEGKEIMEYIEQVPNRKIRRCFYDFFQEIKKMNYQELTTHYVTTFDFNEKTTLYLTYRIFGDNRERGAALIKLKFEYAKADLVVLDDELPDYLPLILEFASIAEEASVKKIFAIHRKAMDELHEALIELKSPYRKILEACQIAITQILANTKAS